MLQFPFAEVAREGETFTRLASFFVIRDDQRILDQFARALTMFRDSPQNATTWQTERPVRTKPSEGKYEVDGKGLDVKGAFSVIWEIRKVNDQIFEIAGNASASCTIAGLDGAPIGSWNMDIGTKDSPGCHFHSSFTSCAKEKWSIAVPRIPSITVSPFSAFEFMLSELFQVDWALRSGTANGAPAWRRLQKKRLERLLRWAMTQIDQPGVSPWVAYKKAKPAPDLFTAPGLP